MCVTFSKCVVPYSDHNKPPEPVAYQSCFLSSLEWKSKFQIPAGCSFGGRTEREGFLLALPPQCADGFILNVFFPLCLTFPSYKEPAVLD